MFPRLQKICRNNKIILVNKVFTPYSITDKVFDSIRCKLSALPSLSVSGSLKRENESGYYDNVINTISMKRWSKRIGTNSYAVAPIAAITATSKEEKKYDVDLNYIPEPPVVEENVEEVLNDLGVEAFNTLGLGGWTPAGIIQNILHYMHAEAHMPWCAAIALGTVLVRMLIFPVVILGQRNSAKLHNHMPEMQALQLKMTEARQTGNAIESAKAAQDMMLFMKEKNLNPLKNAIVPLAQAPLFISFFVGLRGMTNAPVESMRDGGMLWFMDLTVPDGIYLLPIITSTTLLFTVELSTLSVQNRHMIKYVLRALPIIIFPFTMNFPAAILTYWACSNFISLGQVAFLRIPAVREYFQIETMIKHNPSELPIKKKGFVKDVKESWQNMKITKELEDRQRLDEILFAKAGKGPLIKTYKHDPLKARSTPIVLKELKHE